MVRSPEFVIVGAGSLGLSFAALLARAGERVTLLATPRSASRLRASGTITLAGAVDALVGLSDTRAGAGAGSVVLTTRAADLPRDAVVLFTTKGHDLPEAIDTVRAAANARVAWTAGVQNGIVKDDLLARAFGADRVVGAATIFGAHRETGTDASGAVQVMSPGATYLGEFGGHISERVRHASDSLSAAGIPTRACEDISSVLWSKACNATGVFGVTVLTRASNQHLFANPHLMRAYLVLVRETAAVAAAYGVQVGNYPSFPPIRTFVESDDDVTIDRLPPAVPARNAEPSYASMTQDVLAGRRLEVDAVFGDIVERGELKGVPVPCLRLARDVIRGLDGVRQSVGVG